MYRVFFITILLATAYSHNESALPLDEDDGWELLPAEEHACVHDEMDNDPLKDWKAKYVPNPFSTIEEHIESYRDQALRTTLLNQPWEGLRVNFDYSKLEQLVGDKPTRDFIIEEICEPNRNFFENLYKIKRNPAGVSSGFL